MLQRAFMIVVVSGLSSLCGCYPSESKGPGSAARPSQDRQEGGARKSIPSQTDKHDQVVLSARVVLDQIQSTSIADNVEFCGYILEAPDGSLRIAGPERGTVFNCTTPIVYKPYRILASFHTHGGFDPRTLTEMPSSTDFDVVASEQVDAFIATPGGRFWHVEFQTGLARLLCGPDHCLPQDGAVKLSYDTPDTLDRSQVLKIEQLQGITNRR